MGGVAKWAGGVVENATGIDMGNNSATDMALRSQTQATGQANQALTSAYQPWQTSGLKALAGLESGNILQNFQGDPGYQFRLGEGMKALQNSAAAKGNLNSGATLKALTRYGQDFASNEYNTAYNREYGRLNDLARFGYDASSQLGTGLSNNYMGLGNANAAARINQANQTNQLLNSAIGATGASLGGRKA